MLNCLSVNKRQLFELFKLSEDISWSVLQAIKPCLFGLAYISSVGIKPVYWKIYKTMLTVEYPQVVFIYDKVNGCVSRAIWSH